MTERCEDLDLFFDRELEPEAEHAYREHLAGCSRCQEVLLGRMLEATVVSEDRDSRPSIDPIPTVGVDGAAPPPDRAPERTIGPPSGPPPPSDRPTRTTCCRTRS
ncbi:MAG TPA: zf-HC2 domain-containing protein, partial [Kofleriaceae bacterium]